MRESVMHALATFLFIIAGAVSGAAAAVTYYHARVPVVTPAREPECEAVLDHCMDSLRVCMAGLHQVTGR